MAIDPLFEKLLAPLAPRPLEPRDPAESKIVTIHEFPPIPDRRWDWRAYRDGDEEVTGKHGWGRTEAEAVADLLQTEADNQ